MALQRKETDDFGATHNAAYWKVTTVEIGRGRGEITWRVSCYVDKAAADAGKLPVKGESFAVSDADSLALFDCVEMDKAGCNPVKTCYGLTKQDPRFAGAVDV